MFILSLKRGVKKKKKVIVMYNVLQRKTVHVGNKKTQRKTYEETCNITVLSLPLMVVNARRRKSVYIS